MIDNSIDIDKINLENLVEYKSFFFDILKHSEKYLFQNASFLKKDLNFFHQIKTKQTGKIEVSCFVKSSNTRVNFLIRKISHRSLLIDICLKTLRYDLNFNAVNLIEKETLSQVEIKHCFFIEGEKEKIVDTAYVFHFERIKEWMGNILMLCENAEEGVINFDILKYSKDKKDYVAISDSFKILNLDMNRLKIAKDSDQKLPVEFEDVFTEKEMTLVEALLI